MLYLGTTQDAGGPVNTLANMRVELAAGRDRVTRQPGAKYLSGEHWLQFVDERCLRHFNASHDQERESEVELFALAQLGQRLSIWEALGQYDGPLSPEDRAQLSAARQEIRRALPPALRTDSDADWSRWPGDAALVLPEP